MKAPEIESNIEALQKDKPIPPELIKGAATVLVELVVSLIRSSRNLNKRVDELEKRLTELEARIK